MRLLHRTEHRETEERVPEVHEDLPELPEGITVPDDISGLELTTGGAPGGRTTSIRWLPWTGLAALLAIGGVALALVLANDDGGTETRATSSVLVQESVDEALAQRVAVDRGPNADLAPELMAASVPETRATSSLLVQEAIDQALAERATE